MMMSMTPPAHNAHFLQQLESIRKSRVSKRSHHQSPPDDTTDNDMHVAANAATAVLQTRSSFLFTKSPPLIVSPKSVDNYTTSKPQQHNIKPIQRRIWQRQVQHVVYVDGSFHEKTGRAGAGIWFAEGDDDNTYIPVPLPPSSSSSSSLVLRSCSLRAELYAAVVAVYICQTKRNIDLRHSLILIKQDCVAAIELLRFVLQLPKAPSRWIAEEPMAKTWSVVLPWHETLDYNTLITFVDVLDAWWCLCLHANNVEFKWIPAHLDKQGTRKQRCFNATTTTTGLSPPRSVSKYTYDTGSDDTDSDKDETNNNTLNIDKQTTISTIQTQTSPVMKNNDKKYRISEEDRLGNCASDQYARAAASLEASAADQLNLYINYPLFPKSRRDPALDFLPHC